LDVEEVPPRQPKGVDEGNAPIPLHVRIRRGVVGDVAKPRGSPPLALEFAAAELSPKQETAIEEGKARRRSI
jgi:hypothetical protein